MSIVAITAAEQEAAEGPSINMAALEGQSLNRGKTREQIRQESEDNRTEQFRNHFEWIAIIALWAIAGVVFLMGLFWAFHLVAPACWRWLSKEDLSSIQTILTASVLLGVVSGHFKKRME